MPRVRRQLRFRIGCPSSSLGYFLLYDLLGFLGLREKSMEQYHLNLPGGYQSVQPFVFSCVQCELPIDLGALMLGIFWEGWALCKWDCADERS